MKRRDPKIDKIIAIAGAEERQSGVETGRSRSQLNDHLRRLTELNAYRQSYASNLPSNDQLRSAHWKDYQNFLSRLDQAVHAQQQIIQDCERQLESHRRRWMSKRQRLDSLQRVQKRYLRAATARAEHQEQRTLDDLPAAPDLYEEEDR